MSSLATGIVYGTDWGGTDENVPTLIIKDCHSIQPNQLYSNVNLIKKSCLFSNIDVHICRV